MALTPNLAKVRVTGSFVDSQGTADTGTVTFQLSTYLLDPVFNQVITNQLITCNLVNGQIFDQGRAGVELVATNDPDLYPAAGVVGSAYWTVTERITGLPPRSYPIKLDHTWVTYDLADLRDLAGNPGAGTGSQGNVGGVGDGTGGVPNPGTGTPAPGGSATPTSHASTHAVGGSDPLTPAAIGAATTQEVSQLRLTVQALSADLQSAINRVAKLEAGAPTNATAPGIPTSVRAVAGDGRVTVSFVAPISNGGSPILGYRVTLSNALTAEGVSSPITVTNLANDEPVSASVVAINAVGTSVASAPTAPVTPTGGVAAVVPGQPTGVTATAGAGQASVSFAPPASNGGAAIISYRVTASTGQVATGMTSPVVVTGLTNGAAVTFTVVAINSVGTSAASVPSAPVVPATAPDAPTGVTAVPGDARATVSFTAPTSNGGSGILDYTVTASTGQVVTGASSPVTVTGLTNGVAVSFTVRARNSVGTSPASSASGAVTPVTGASGTGTPSTPTNVSVTVGGTAGAATIQWSVPVSTGTSALTGYRLVRIDSAGVSAEPVFVPANVGSYTWTGLTAGATYTLTVAAVNASGAGSAAAVLAMVPTGTPVNAVELLSPQQVSTETTDLSGFTVNGTGITLSRDSAWASSGAYSLRVSSGSGVANSSGVNYERIPVTPGTQYRFAATMLRGTDKTIGVVFKWRDANNNALSNGELALHDGTLGSTSIISQTGTAPAGAVFLRVTVQYAQTGMSTLDYFNLDSATVTEFSGNNNGGPVTTPSKPEQVTAIANASAGSVTIRWAYNTSGTSAPVTGFHVARDGTDADGYGPFETDIYLTTGEFTFTRLVPGQTYTFSVAGVNDAGRGPAYMVSLLMPAPGSTGTATTYPGSTTYPSASTYPGQSADTVPTNPNGNVPGAPTGVSVTATQTDRKPTVTWVAPSTNGGSAISGYVVNWTANDGTTGAPQTVAAGVLTYTYATSFTPSTVVTFSVRAVNSAGQSTPGTFTYTMPALTTSVPAQPATVTAATTGTGEVTVTWTPPASDGGSVVTGYLAGRDGTDSTGYGPWTTPTPLASTVRTQVFTQLVPGQTYRFSVSAVNAQGTGTARTVSFAIPAAAATTSVSTTPGVNSLTVNWTLPSGTSSSTVSLNTGTTSGTLGPAVTSYTFTNLTAGTSYTATVRVTTSANGVATGTATGTPTSATTGTNPLNFKAFTIGANVTGAANGEFNRWIGKKHGQYSTWGGSDESPYWDGGSEFKRGRPWGILGSTAEYGVSKEASLGVFDVDVAPQFGPHSWVAAGNGSEAGFESFIRTRLTEFKSAWGNRGGDAYYRPYHEFNGNWYAWSVRNTADQDGFRNAWIRMRTIWNEVMAGDKRFKLVWSPNRDSKYNLDVRRCWPGKQYADVIGVDYYDYAVSKDGTEADWSAEYNRTQNGGGPVGIGAWQAFAKAEGVPLSLPEWGEQFGDNLFFLQKMKLFFDANYYSGSGDPAGKVIYCGWHNLYAPGGTVDPNATSGNFLIQQNAADYSGRPKASPFWRQYCQNTSYLRWLP